MEVQTPKVLAIISDYLVNRFQCNVTQIGVEEDEGVIKAWISYVDDARFEGDGNIETVVLIISGDEVVVEDRHGAGMGGYTYGKEV